MSNWLKCQTAYKSGLGDPEYIRIGNDSNIEDMKYEWHHQYGDPEGFRQSKFEVLSQLPIHVLKDKTNEAHSKMGQWQKEFMKLDAEYQGRVSEAHRLIPREEFNDDDLYVYDKQTLQLIAQHGAKWVATQATAYIKRSLPEGQDMAKGYIAKSLGLWR